MKTLIADLIQFHRTYGAGIQQSPVVPNTDRQELRKNLVNSEHDEFNDAWMLCQEAKEQVNRAMADNLNGRSDPNNPLSLTESQELSQALKDTLSNQDYAIAELADAIGDLIYVLIGTALEYGISMSGVWDQIQYANMSKLWTAKELQEFTDMRGYRLVTSLPDPYSGLINIPEHNHMPATTWTWDRVILSVLGLEVEDYTTEVRCYIVKNALGKVMKPPGWSAPDIYSTIRALRLYRMHYGTEPVLVRAHEDNPDLEQFRGKVMIMEEDEEGNQFLRAPIDDADVPAIPDKLDGTYLVSPGGINPTIPNPLEMDEVDETEFAHNLGFETRQDYYAWRKSFGGSGA